MAEGKFVSYLRVSTDKQGRSGLGLEAQREAVTSYLNGGRWTVTAEYVETASVAELEAGLIGERTKNALAAAKRRGVRLGNPNGARALRGKQTGNAEAVAKIKANAVQRAQGLNWIVEDITRSGVTTVRGIAEELNRRGVHAPRGNA